MRNTLERLEGEKNERRSNNGLHKRIAYKLGYLENIIDEAMLYAQEIPKMEKRLTDTENLIANVSSVFGEGAKKELESIAKDIKRDISFLREGAGSLLPR